jgi:alpha-D-xyloside xylohydrolase
VNEAVKTYAKIHKNIAYYIKELINENKTLLLRPMWYENDEQKELFSVSDQYMLGPDIVVAPILESDMKTRTVILPKGEWKDVYSGEVIGQGRIQVEVECPKIPVYIRSSNERLYGAVHEVIRNMKTGFVKSKMTTATYQAGINRDLRVTG